MVRIPWKRGGLAFLALRKHPGLGIGEGRIVHNGLSGAGSIPDPNSW